MFARIIECLVFAVMIVSLAIGQAGCADKSPTDHFHDAQDITTGTLDNARLNMGAGNGIDADMVDGHEASDFALVGHTHTGVDADLLDGLDSTAFAAADHVHPPVLWVASDRCNTGGKVEVDTTDGHLSVDDDGLFTVDQPGIYRIRAYAQTTCSSMWQDSCTTSQAIVKNGVEVEGSFYRSAADQSQFQAKHDSTYVGRFALGDTFAVAYECSIPDNLNNSCSGCLSPAGLQIEFLGEQ